jgi:NhaC family Na+:H+ antiporter
MAFIEKEIRMGSDVAAKESTLSPQLILGIPLWKAWLPIIFLMGLLFYNVSLYHDGATSGPNQIALLLAAAVAVVMGKTLGFDFPAMLNGVKSSIYSALTAMLILLIIGALIGTWVISGVVPAMIYYGLEILDAKIFLAASVVVCAIVSVATGSSWSTVATVGVALMGIGAALGVSPAYTAGAVISGSYFGDKISPLSDTTNLAAAMAGTDLVTHIRYMLYTTVPSILITLGAFFMIGYSTSETPSIAQTEALQSALRENFHLSPWLFLVPAAVLAMVMLRLDPIMALFIGTLLGGLCAVVMQPNVIIKLAGVEPAAVVENSEGAPADRRSVETLSPAEGETRQAALSGTFGPVDTLTYLKYSYRVVIDAMSIQVRVISPAAAEGWQAEMDELRLQVAREQLERPDLTAEELSELKDYRVVPTPKMIELEGKISAAELTKGKGMSEMLNTIWLIICAMTFGGVMEACGLLQRIAHSLLSIARSTGSLVATTAGSCLFVNVTASDQYLAIVLPGRMFAQAFKERGLAPQNLSRTLEDSGTVTSVLIPWNTCGAVQQGTLGVSALAYAPFCFFNWISPLMTITFAMLNIRIARLPISHEKNTDRLDERSPESGMD